MKRQYKMASYSVKNNIQKYFGDFLTVEETMVNSKYICSFVCKWYFDLLRTTCFFSKQLKCMHVHKNGELNYRFTLYTITIVIIVK